MKPFEVDGIWYQYDGEYHDVYPRNIYEFFDDHDMSCKCEQGTGYVLFDNPYHWSANDYYYGKQSSPDDIQLSALSGG